MAQYRVASPDDIGEGECVLVRAGETEVGVFRVQGDLHAYENRCPHQGGPVCKGTILGRLEETVGAGGRVATQAYSTDRLDITCPWHGWEFDLATGHHIGDRRFGLRRFDVFVVGADVVLSVPSTGDAVPVPEEEHRT